MVQVHDPVDEFAVHVEPVFVHVPVVASVSDDELAVAIESCTFEVTGALPVKLSERLDVMLSVEDVPLSEAVARSGTETVGKT